VFVALSSALASHPILFTARTRPSLGSPYRQVRNSNTSHCSGPDGLHLRQYNMFPFTLQWARWLAFTAVQNVSGNESVSLDHMGIPPEGGSAHLTSDSSRTFQTSRAPRHVLAVGFLAVGLKSRALAAISALVVLVWTPPAVRFRQKRPASPPDLLESEYASIQHQHSIVSAWPV